MFSLDENFFKLVLDMLKNGLRTQTYQLRATVLADFFKLTPLIIDHHMLECTTEVGSLARKLFRQWPSISEISRCKCGFEKEQNLTAIQVEDFLLKSSTMDTFVEEFCSTPNPGYCTTCFPSNTKKELIRLTITTTLSNIGNNFIKLQFFLPSHSFI